MGYSLADCSSLPLSKDAELEPDADIAGIGVTIGFVGNAYFALAVLIVFYIFGYDPRANPFEDGRPGIRSSAVDTSWWRPNRIDCLVIDFIERNSKPVIRILPQRWREKWTAEVAQDALGSCLLSTADLQLLTGFSIIICGFFMLPGGISAYHWQILIRLGWFANVTHLSGLVALRGYYRPRPLARYFRLGLTFCFLVMLIAGTIPVMFFDFNDPSVQFREGAGPVVSEAAPAVCFYDINLAQKLLDTLRDESCAAKNPEDWAENSWCRGKFKNWGGSPVTGAPHFQVALYGMIIVLYSFTVRVMHLNKPVSKLLATRVWNREWRWVLVLRRRSSQDDLDGATQSRSKFHVLSSRVLERLENLFSVFWITLLLTIRFHMDLARSMLGEIHVLLLSLIWGTRKLRDSRSSPFTDPSVVEAEREWSFGQTLPVLLLVGPIIMVIRAFVDAAENPTRGGKLQEQPDTSLPRQHSGLRVRARTNTFGSLARGATLREHDQDEQQQQLSSQSEGKVRSSNEDQTRNVEIRERDPRQEQAGNYQNLPYLKTGIGIIAISISATIVVPLRAVEPRVSKIEVIPDEDWGDQYVSYVTLSIVAHFIIAHGIACCLWLFRNRKMHWSGGLLFRFGLFVFAGSSFWPRIDDDTDRGIVCLMSLGIYVYALLAWALYEGVIWVRNRIGGRVGARRNKSADIL